MNEPAIFDTPTKTMPLDTMHRIEGDGFASRPATHAEMHNVYGMQNSRATYEGLLTLRPERPAVRDDARKLCRRAALCSHLDRRQQLDLGPSEARRAAAAQPRPVRLRLVGRGCRRVHRRSKPRPDDPLVPDRRPSTPVFRSHAANDAPRAEPWVDGPEHLAIRRRFIEERYRLMPYFYAVAEQTSRTGDPFMRPIFYDYPRARQRRRATSRWPSRVGRDLLVAASPKPESPQPYDVCMPGTGLVRLLERPAGRRRDQARRTVRNREGNARDRPPARVRPRGRDPASPAFDPKHVGDTERPARAARLSGAGLQRPALLGRRGEYPRRKPSPDRSAARSARTASCSTSTSAKAASGRGGSRSR